MASLKVIHARNPSFLGTQYTKIKSARKICTRTLALSTGDKRQALRDMLAFISENNILHLKDFADHCMSEDAPAGWFEILTERNTLFIKEYIKSNWQKQRIDDSDNYYSEK
ncbi:Rep family protein [Lacticaseibacillus paracasei]|uniref:Rep family protein n=1 Tax=Lacticaseibacillus paracasei TaxID=1597 RepID=UPI001CDAF7A8|nr:Rep family protein [Lacticaseibacillus paracasei]